MCGWEACVARGMHSWEHALMGRVMYSWGGGACVAEGHVWHGLKGKHTQLGGMCGWGHAWRGACMAGGMHGWGMGHRWLGDMHGWRIAWLGRGHR